MNVAEDTLDSVRALVAEMCGAPCSALEPLTTGGSTSAAYSAAVGAERIVVKVNVDPAALAGSGRNLDVLHSLGLPVPRVYGYDGSRTRCPVAVLVLRALPGRDLRYELAGMTAAQVTELARQVVAMQRSVAALPRNSGCGYVGIGEPATRTWSQVVRVPNHRPLLDPLPAGVADLRKRLAVTLDAFEEYFATIEPVCFLDDLTTKNVMVLYGELTGVVDFDVVCYGDPLFHLGLTAAAVSADLPERCRFYVDELLRLSGCDEADRRVVTLYEAVHLTEFISRQPFAEADLAAVLSLAHESLATVEATAATRHPRPYELTSSGALAAAKAGNIEGWVHDFLTAPGNPNVAFSDGLRQQQRWWIGPVATPVGELTRTVGPESGMPYAVASPSQWEQRLTELARHLRDSSWDVPPVMANGDTDALVLNDGNHRYETLRRSGAFSVSALLWFSDEEAWRSFDRPWVSDGIRTVGAAVFTPRPAAAGRRAGSVRHAR